MRTAQWKDGTTIAFDSSGDGRPVVIVAGALSGRFTNARLAELLSVRFAVLNYDRRGRGDSGDAQNYAVEREIADLEAIIGEAGGSAFVFGSSSGGNLAVRAAASGLNISKLALWEPNFLVDDSRPPLPEDYVEQIRQLVASNRNGDAVELFMTKAVGLPQDFVAPMRQAPHWPAMEAAAHTLAYDGSVVDGFALPAVSSLAVPTLVLDGGTTPWLSNGAQAIADALPEGRRRTLEGQTHDVSAEALAPALEEFFA
jgi:pimeloyl-ACP methyl ester carboxylesterase